MIPGLRVLLLAAATLFSCAGAKAAEEVPTPAPMEPLKGPWTVAIQPGHWKVDELPDELYRLRGSTGAVWGKVREADINLAVARALMALVEAEGWKAVLVPATVPPDLRADAFVSIHADGAVDTARRGWKLSPPWRSSPAARALAAAVSGAFAAQSDLVHDADGVTVGMRGYFGFSSHRFVHASSPYTPAIVVEMGFVTNAQDRRLLVGQPDRFARILRDGLRAYFVPRDRDRVDDLAPARYPWFAVGAGGAAVMASPRETARVLTDAEPGALFWPVDKQGDWYQVFVRSLRSAGWIREDDLRQASF